jgi:hypothetical protein
VEDDFVSNNDLVFGGDGDDKISIFSGDGGAGNDVMAGSLTFQGSSGIDFLDLSGAVDFGAAGQNVAAIEGLDLRDASFGNAGGADTVTLALADILDFAADATTGELFGADAIDLVIRGDANDTVNLAPGSGFANVGSQSLGNAVYGGAGVAYDIYANGAGQIVAVEDVIATVNTS